MLGKYYRGKTVLVTGHTGFKGGWISLWLKELGAKVHGLALRPHTSPNLYETLAPGTFVQETYGDICDVELVKRTLLGAPPDIVFHLAAQPIVRRSFKEPLETASTNILGTLNILEGLRQNNIDCPVVVVTSDKCYQNDEGSRAFVEGDPLGGHDVYSASKAAAEIMVRSWSLSFNVRVATARAGNVIGGGDYGEDRIVPDCVRALEARETIAVRNPQAARPWQHVLDCVSGYMLLGTKLAEDESLADAFNFGPKPESKRTVRELVESFLLHWPGKWQDTSAPDSPHEAATLSLNINKAEAHLGWRPVLDFSQAVEYAAQWYKERDSNKESEMHSVCVAQLEDYTRLAAQPGPRRGLA